MALKLYSYWRSSSAYRVRIALQLKGLDHEILPVHLVREGGEQHQPTYRALNPAGKVPLLVDGDFRLSQSLAIFEYLEQTHPRPALLPDAAQDRARVWAACLQIACDIQPLQNLAVLQHLSGPLGHPESIKAEWSRHWIGNGLLALEAMLKDYAGDCCFGNTPSYADCCLVPQMYNAERFAVDLSAMPTLVRIARSLRQRPEFLAAHPDQQVDAQPA